MKATDFHILKGPLGGYKNYLTYIALPNCIDYLECLKKQRENAAKKTPDKHARFRHFINAIESLNNVPDYLYFDCEYEKRKIRIDTIRKAICKIVSCMKEINDIANAYKHCKRGTHDKNNTFIENKDKIHAKDLTSSQVVFRVGMRVERPLVETDFVFQTIDNETIVQNAFKFWVDHINNENNNNLLSEIDKLLEKG